MTRINVHNSPSADWLRIVQENAGGLRYGVIQITIHDSRIVQIECTEKTRLDQLTTQHAPGANYVNA